jgi:sugar O-acyltransferase (sialic acid O-acetyltransferase NeuD family)
VSRPFVMFGYSHLFGDIVDCIESIDGELREVLLNVPEVPKPGRPTLFDRITRLNRFGRSVRIGDIREFRRRSSDECYVIGFSRKQAAPLIRDLESWIGCPANPTKHRTSITQLGAEIGHWSIVNAGAIIGSWARIGRHVIANRGANIGHDCEIGDHSFISPGATICGHVKIGKNVMIGANATILPDLKIGDDAVVAAGAVVTSWVNPNSMVAGVPAVVKKDFLT